MSAIQNFLDYLLHAEFGKDVRQGIHDSIKQCYDDATGNPESVAAVVEQNDKMKELLENTPYTTVESDGEFELPVHTINDNKISDDSTWSSKKIIDAIYPIGSIYMSVNNVNPSELLGGTWEVWGSGRVPVGVKASDTDFSAVEKTGGHKEMQEHEHAGLYWNKDSTMDSGAISLNSGSGSGYNLTFGAGYNSAYKNYIRTRSAGTGDSGNLQPYITCYMWKRTA